MMGLSPLRRNCAKGISFQTHLHGRPSRYCGEQLLCYDARFERLQLPDLQSWRIFRMSKSWVLCVLLGAMAWGQAPPGTATTPPSPAQVPNGTAASAGSEVLDDAPVLTVFGVCPAT